MVTPGYTLYVYILPNDIQKKDYNMKIGAGPGRPGQEVRGKEGLYISPSTRMDQDHLVRTDH